MRKAIFFLIFAGTYFQAQNIEDKEAFKKCHKEFSKKICLSDEDQDGILFYLDQCPKEAGSLENKGCPWPDKDKDGVLDKDDKCPELSGPVENNGCPWPDYDGDGILDKDDACPTIPGITELNGCPSKKNDCTEYWEKAGIRLKKFKTDYADIESVYDKINKIALDAVIKKGYTKALTDKKTYLYIKYINNIAYFDQHSCYDGTDPEYNFLISKFWNKKVLEYARKKYGKDIYLSTKIPSEDLTLYQEIGMSNETFDYITKYYDPETMKVKIPGNHTSEIGAAHSIPFVITFITPYQIKVEDPKTNIIILYEYKNNNWELIKE